ncbi:MAG: hypothetical protein J1E01_08125 [Acetatifactor sp.]|nr:hypothetical protein [Acetatifactor sp.]
MRIEYNICKADIICGEITSELTGSEGRSRWVFEYAGSDCFKHIDAELDSSMHILRMKYDMHVSAGTVSSQIERVNDWTYLINGREVKTRKMIAVFEMIFLLGSGRVFDNAVLYNPPTDDFTPINLKESGDKYAVLYPGLCNILVSAGHVSSCEMPRDDMMISVRN